MNVQSQATPEQMEERLRRAEAIANSANVKTQLGLAIGALAVTTAVYVAVDARRRYSSIRNEHDMDVGMLLSEIDGINDRLGGRNPQ